MAKYEVIIPYFGVTLGQVVEIDGEPNSAFKANLRKLPEEVEEVEEVAKTSKTGNNWKK